MFCKSVLTLSILFGAFHNSYAGAQTAASSPLHNAPKTSLTVTLTGIRNDKGQVFIQLWNAPQGFLKQGVQPYKCFVIDTSKAVNGTVTTTFADLTPGTYAVNALHDENRNSKMDTNTFGIPKEGWAVSNNVVAHMHAPSYEQASFQLASSGQTFSIALHY